MPLSIATLHPSRTCMLPPPHAPVLGPFCCACKRARASSYCSLVGAAPRGRAAPRSHPFFFVPSRACACRAADKRERRVPAVCRRCEKVYCLPVCAVNRRPKVQVAAEGRVPRCPSPPPTGAPLGSGLTSTSRTILGQHTLPRRARLRDNQLGRLCAAHSTPCPPTHQTCTAARGCSTGCH